MNEHRVRKVHYVKLACNNIGRTLDFCKVVFCHLRLFKHHVVELVRVALVVDFDVDCKARLEGIRTAVCTAGNKTAEQVGIGVGHRKTDYCAVAVTDKIGLFKLHFFNEFLNVLCHEVVGNYARVAAFAVAAAVNGVDRVAVCKIPCGFIKVLVVSCVSVDKHKRGSAFAVDRVMHFNLAELNVALAFGS